MKGIRFASLSVDKQLVYLALLGIQADGTSNARTIIKSRVMIVSLEVEIAECDFYRKSPTVISRKTIWFA